jgi:RNA polymerase sigma-70 factor (ECF subfamily)
MRIGETDPERGNGRPAVDAADAVLAARAAIDPDAFVLLYNRYYDAVAGFCFHRLGQREDAADATNDIFFKAHRGLAGFRDRDGSFRAWLFAIARHELANHHRGSARRPACVPLADTLSDAAPPTEELALALAELAEVRALLAHLPDRPRQVAELRLAGLNDHEIATVLGTSYANARQAGSRAVEQLRRLRAATGGTEGVR